MQQKQAKTNDFRQSLGPGTKEMALAGRKSSCWGFDVRLQGSQSISKGQSGCQTPNFNAQFWGVQTFNFRQVSPSHLTCPNSICSRVFMQQFSVENGFSKCSTGLAGCRLKCKSDGATFVKNNLTHFAAQAILDRTLKPMIVGRAVMFPCSGCFYPHFGWSTSVEQERSPGHTFCWNKHGNGNQWNLVPAYWYQVKFPETDNT